MLRFLTHKLRTQSLNEEQEEGVEKDPEEHDSGTESDDESGETGNGSLHAEQNKVMEGECENEWGLEGSSGVFPIHFISRASMDEPGTDFPGGGRDSASSQFEYIDSALPSDSDHAYDHHSSEEELEDINNSYEDGDDQGESCLLGDDEVRGPGSDNKRKWSQVASNRLSVESSASSSDEEVQGLLRPVSTPVEFCTSPPVDAHKPSRSQSPPPKLFLFSSPGCENSPGGGRVGGSAPVAIHTGGVFRGLRRCDQNVVDHHRHSHGGSPGHQTHFSSPYGFTPNGTGSYPSPPTANTGSIAESRSQADQANSLNLGSGGVGGVRSGRQGLANGVEIGGRNGKEPSSRKRHRHHNPRHIQRPWLDFEKMQQDEYIKCVMAAEKKDLEGEEACRYDIESKTSCWKGVVQKIEECFPGRGNTVEKIYTAFRLEFTCQKSFTDRLAEIGLSGDVCAAVDVVTKECSDVQQMTSPDLCTSFNAQKSCEESNLALCKHERHKELLKKHFKHIGTSLECPEPAGKDVSPEIMMPNDEVSISRGAILRQSILVLLMVFVSYIWYI